MRWFWDRSRQQADQSASAADQTTADKDQTASDTDQSASDRDQIQADADQRASDRDQAASDRDLANRATRDSEMERTHELSRAERVETTLDRHSGSLVRAEVSFDRDEHAKQRDEVAHQRDRVAEERDRVAEVNEREMKRVGEDLGGADPWASQAFVALEEMRDKAAAQRMQAATDRARAATDREAAAADRQHLLAELERAHLDDLTGAYRRGMGEIAVINEIERSRRSHQVLVMAYIDSDGLKGVNDREGHAAGDALLRDLVALLRSKLRPYDPVVRWGGDEFICTFSDTDLEGARKRFEEIRVALAEKGGAPVSVGFALLGEGDTLETLIERADAALLEARARKRLRRPTAPHRVVALGRYKVQFRTESGLPDEARGALQAAGIQLTKGQGGVSHGEPGGELRDVSTHYAWVDADGEDAAGRALTEALEGKTVAFELLGVEPLKSD